MKDRTAILAGALIIGLAAPSLYAQGAKPPVTNPSSAKARTQADGSDDILAGRKGAPGMAKKGGAQASQGQGQEPNTPQARKSRQASQGQGQEPNTPQGPAARKQMAPAGQGNPGQAGGGQWQKGDLAHKGELKGAASAKQGAASAKAAQMQK